ncbi:MAG: dihydrodipicolinate synthase family protein [Victivallales bacterium]|nr:dihydrodipicolinate synthase family protein [Victivallales bacterium]
MQINEIDKQVLEGFRQGVVIPAMPLALDKNRQFSPIRQRALARYYIDAGVGGIAAGVHSTQFEIRNPEVGLFETVLAEVSGYIDQWTEETGRKILKVAGVCGKTEQALYEAGFAVKNGYDACLLSMGAYANDSIEAMLAHVRAVAEVMPVIGFYLQPSAGGRILPHEFWYEFAKIDNILGIKMAPFNRYQTLDVVRALAEAGKEEKITLYTGNDDNIIIDLISEYKIGAKALRIKGGLLGHWCVWTKKAVELLDEIHTLIASGQAIPNELLSRNIQVTDANAAFFDPAHDFAGCIPGIHEVLRRQGLFAGIWCLNPGEVLSPGQSDEITRVYQAYPHLHDDEFVKSNLERWLQA